MQPWRDERAAERFLRNLLKALAPKFKSEGPDEPGLCGRVAASHVHIAHARVVQNFERPSQAALRQ